MMHEQRLRAVEDSVLDKEERLHKAEVIMSRIDMWYPNFMLYSGSGLRYLLPPSGDTEDVS